MCSSDLDYRALVLRGPEGDDEEKREAPRVNRKDERRAAAELREKTQSLRQAVKAAETEMAKLEKKRAELEAKLIDPKLTGKERGESMKSHGDISRQIEAAEARWMEASLALEEAVNA